MNQPYMLSIPYFQYHSCWCPGDLSRQGISMHDIDQISQNISSLASEELMFVIYCSTYFICLNNMLLLNLNVIWM